MNITNKNKEQQNENSFFISKKVILTVLVFIVTSVGYAQLKTVSEAVFSPPIQSSTEILRITDDMSKNDIELELINNFYKLELADVIVNHNYQVSKTEQFIQNESVNSNYKVISDVTVRTTREMRSSLHLYDVGNA